MPAPQLWTAPGLALTPINRSNFNPMPNFSKSTCDRDLIRPSTNQRGYQQALDDFAIASLLSRLQTLCNTEFDAVGMNVSQSELESLAAILIRELTATLNGKIVSGYLKTMGYGGCDLPISFSHKRFSAVELPTSFPHVKPPRFLYGDKLQWIRDRADSLNPKLPNPPTSPDWGTAIGRFYGFASHHCGWTWCYLIWLDKCSPSSRWTVADTAWEDDLEPWEESR